MKKKSLLGFLDEVAKERGFDKFSHSTDVGKVYVVEEIIKEAGKRYVRQYLNIAAHNAELDFEQWSGDDVDNKSSAVFEDGIGQSCKVFVEKSSITNIEIDV